MCWNILLPSLVVKVSLFKIRFYASLHAKPVVMSVLNVGSISFFDLIYFFMGWNTLLF